MQLVANDAINRARVYIEDDHVDGSSFLTPASWLTLFNVEYRTLYRKWVRASLVAPPSVDQAFVGASVQVSNVLAVIGVAEDLGYIKRPLVAAQSRYGRSPYWSGTNNVGKSDTWRADGPGDNLTFNLDPQDVTGNYLVRYIPKPQQITDVMASVEVPDGGDEYLVLKLARRAHIKDTIQSRLLDEHIRESEAELNFTAFTRVNGDSPRVRRGVSRFRMNDRFGASFATDPWFWYYPN